MKSILLVEDESIIALSESQMLRARGFAIEIAKSGEEALRLIDGGLSPGLILMDVELGSGIDGFAAAREILSRRSLPLVFLTAKPSRGLGEEMLKLGLRVYAIGKTGDYYMLSCIEMAYDLFERERLLASLEEDELLSIPRR